MHRMDKQERKMHTAHEIRAVERELMRRSADVPTEEDSYGAEEVKYVKILMALFGKNPFFFCILSHFCYLVLLFSIICK